MMKPTKIITQVPTQAELGNSGFSNPVYNRKVYERVPYSYGRALDHSDPGADSLQNLLNSLNNELQWGDPEARDRTVESAYLVARSIGDSVLGAASGKALELIDSTRQGTRNGTRFKDSTVEGAMGHVTTYRDGSAEYGIDINNLGIDRVRSRLADQGFEAPPMLVVLVLLHTAGHEAGHMIQRGISQTGLTRAEGVSSFDSFSDLVLRNCPDARLTLDPQENVAIHNERFAEGYANITLRAAVESLGYDGDYADAVVRAIAIDEVSPTMKEHIAKTTTETTVAQSYEQAGLSPEYLGMLGYTRPLTLDQIVADLEFANNKATLIADKRLGINSTDGYDETLIDIARAYKVMPSDRIEKSSREVTAHKGMRVGRRIMLAISHFLNAKPISVKK